MASRHDGPGSEIARDNFRLPRLVPMGLEYLVEAAEEYGRQALTDATRGAYESDLTCFRDWCDSHGLGWLPAAPETVALYLAWLAPQRKHSTLKRRMSAISQAHRKAGLEPPTRSVLVEETWKGIRRVHGVAVHPKAPARTAAVRRMVGALDLDRLIGVRDRALLVMGFAGAFRRAELVAIDVDDVTEVDEGLKVSVRRSKTDQEGEGASVGLPYGSDPLTCPVRAYRAWLDASGIPRGPVFRPVTKGGALGLRRLSPHAVAAVVKRSAERVGIDPGNLAGHSLRSGMITTAAEEGVHERDIMRHSRHQSILVMRGYIRDATLFKDNAAARIGL